MTRTRTNHPPFIYYILRKSRRAFPRYADIHLVNGDIPGRAASLDTMRRAVVLASFAGAVSSARSLHPDVEVSPAELVGCSEDGALTSATRLAARTHSAQLLG